MVSRFFDKKSALLVWSETLTTRDKSSSGEAIKNEITSNKELTAELHEPIVRKFEKRKVHSSFIDNIWCADLTGMQLMNKFNKGFRILLCVMDIYGKHTWVIPLKDNLIMYKVYITDAFQKILDKSNAFQKILDKSNRKPDKLCADKGIEFYNRSVKSWLEKNTIEMYLTHNEVKFVVTERLIRTLISKIYKYITSTSKSVYINKLVDIVNKYNNTYHSTIKMKPVDVKSSTYIDFDNNNNKEDS